MMLKCKLYEEWRSEHLMLFLSEEEIREDKVKGIAKCIVKGIAEGIAEDQVEDWAIGWVKGRALENLTLFLSEEEIREKSIVEGIARGIAKGVAEDWDEDWDEDWAEDWVLGWIEGIVKGGIENIQRLIKNGQSKEFVLNLGYKEEDYKKAEEALRNRLDLTVQQEKPKLHEEWSREYVMLLLHDEEIREEGIAKGIAKGKIAMIQSLIEKGQSKEFILTLDCSEEEYKKAEEMLHEKV